MMTQQEQQKRERQLRDMLEEDELEWVLTTILNWLDDTSDLDRSDKAAKRWLVRSGNILEGALKEIQRLGERP